MRWSFLFVASLHIPLQSANIFMYTWLLLRNDFFTVSTVWTWNRMRDFWLPFDIYTYDVNVKHHLSWRCSNNIIIPDLTPGFNGLIKDNCKTRQETFKFWVLVPLTIEVYGIWMVLVIFFSSHWRHDSVPLLYLALFIQSFYQPATSLQLRRCKVLYVGNHLFSQQYCHTIYKYVCNRFTRSCTCYLIAQAPVKQP